MENDNEKNGLTALRDNVFQLKQEIAKVIVGQDKLIDLLIVSLLANGHVLLEGVPGVAKTLTIRLLSQAVSASYSRIQFTPDLMPSDVTGTSVFNTGTGAFEFVQGPIFANLVLIDEINRAPAKTQSALFEVMQERQVTIDGKAYKMAAPFAIFATQNPLEHEGTYQLPEAQMDRFLFKLNVGYPAAEDEVKILHNAHMRRGTHELDEVSPVLSAANILNFQKQVHFIKVEDNLIKYISDLAIATRNHPSVYLGASPRAATNILISAKAMAAIQGRDFVIPEDIHLILNPVMEHRIYLTPEKELEGIMPADVVSEIIHSLEIPR